MLNISKNKMAIVPKQEHGEPKEIIILSSSDEENTREKISTSVIKAHSENQTYNNNSNSKEEENLNYPQILHSFSLQNTKSTHSTFNKIGEETKNNIKLNVQGSSPFENADSSKVPETSGSINKFFDKQQKSPPVSKRFSKLLELCRCSMNDISENDREKIITKMMRHYNSANHLFVSSKNFLSFIEKKIEDIVNDSKNIYVHIEEVCQELKGFSCKKRKFCEISGPSSDTNAKINENNAFQPNDNINSNEKNLFLTNDRIKEERTHDSHIKNRLQITEEKTYKKRIKKLEQLLEKLHHKIRKLQQKELTLDDMNDDESVYIQEARFTNRLMKVWDKLCSLTGRSKKTGRPIEMKFCFNGSRYPEINEKVEKFINKKKIFPDYNDIFNIVMTVNNVVKFSSYQAHSVAREIFEEVGKLLQKRRLEDNRELMGCFLTDNIDLNIDPADENEDMRNQLEESSKIASKDLDDLLESYVLKQVEQKLEPEEIHDNPDLSPSHSSEHDDDDDYDDEPEEISDIEFIEDTLKSDDESSKDNTEIVPKESTPEEELLPDLNNVDYHRFPTNLQLPSTSFNNTKDISESNTKLNQLKRKFKSDEVDSSKKKLCLNNGETIVNENHEEIIILE